MASDDLFVWLDAIWNKKKPEGTFPAYVAHRFLASDELLAPYAWAVGQNIRDPAMAFAVWQGSMPEERGCPRLTYPAPKKRPDAEQLTQRMMTVLQLRRAVAEEMQALIEVAGRLDDLYKEFGVVKDGDGDTNEFDRVKRKKPTGPVGLMALLK